MILARFNFWKGWPVIPVSDSNLQAQRKACPSVQFSSSCMLHGVLLLQLLFFCFPCLVNLPLGGGAYSVSLSRKPRDHHREDLRRDAGFRHGLGGTKASRGRLVSTTCFSCLLELESQLHSSDTKPKAASQASFVFAAN